MSHARVCWSPLVFRTAVFTTILFDVAAFGFVLLPEALAVGCLECHLDDECDNGTGAGDFANSGECDPISGRSDCDVDKSGCEYDDDGCAEFLPAETGCMFASGYCGDNCRSSGGGG